MRSHATLTFMSALRFRRGERWEWTHDPQLAMWRVVDATAAYELEHVLPPEDLPMAPAVALLSSRQISGEIVLSGQQAWTDFPRCPTVAQVFGWVNVHKARMDDSKAEAFAPTEAEHPVSETAAREAETAITVARQRPIAASQPYHAARFRLRRWPNMARYGHDLVCITACAKLLQGMHSFAQARQLGLAEDDLERILCEALQAGNLEMEPAAATDAFMLMEDALLPAPATTRQNSLIQRLLHKFSRKQGSALLH